MKQVILQRIFILLFFYQNTIETPLRSNEKKKAKSTDLHVYFLVSFLSATPILEALGIDKAEDRIKRRT
jgi:hypothetical protein